METKGEMASLDSIIEAIGVDPYHREPAGVIYCADCLDILPKIPEKSIDLVLTDPPYGIDYDTSRKKYKKGQLTVVAHYNKIVNDSGPFQLIAFFYISYDCKMIQWGVIFFGSPSPAIPAGWHG